MSKKIMLLTIILFLLFAMIGCDSSIKKPIGSISNTYIITESPNMKKLKTVYPELYDELLKLPELKENTDKNEKAAEQIARLGLSGKYKAAFESILNEGLKDKRKYCAPLEALLWLAYDKNFEKSNPLDNFNLSSLIRDAWSYTNTSKNFLSKRWSDFNEVTDRLNSPQLIAIYTQFNFRYSYTPGQRDRAESAKQIFNDKKGACYDFALFAAYCLRKGGYSKAKTLTVYFKEMCDGFAGHEVNIYIDPKDNKLYSMDFSLDGLGYDVYGPFTSLDAAANHICSTDTNGKAGLKRYEIYDIDLTKGIHLDSAEYVSPIF